MIKRLTVQFIALFSLLAVQGQDSLTYTHYEHGNVNYMLSIQNGHIEGFASSDTMFRVFTGNRINEYRVTLFDAFTNQPMDALPFDLSVADNTSTTRKFTRYSDSSRFALGAGPDSPDGSLSLSLVIPDNDTLKTAIFRQIAKELTQGKKDTEQSFYELFRYLTEDFQEQYLTANKELYNQYGDECYACSWQKKFTVTPLFFNENYLSVNISRYAFTGGAHGMHHNTIINYDVNTGQHITLDSLVPPKHQDSLNKVISNQLKENYGLQPDESLKKAGLFEDNIEAASNYCITDGGISFIYNPYEIAPYAMGIIIVFIPENNIKSILKH